MNTTKNFYRYHVDIDTKGKPALVEEVIQMKIKTTASGMVIDNYAQAVTDYGFIPKASDIGTVRDGYLWLEESDKDLARTTFLQFTRNKIQKKLSQIETLKNEIQVQGNYLQVLQDLCYEVKNYNPDDIYQYDDMDLDK